MSIVCCGPSHVTHLYFNDINNSIIYNTSLSNDNPKKPIVTSIVANLGEHKNAEFIDIVTGKGATNKYVYALTKKGILCVFIYIKNNNDIGIMAN